MISQKFKPFIFIIAILIASYLYSSIPFGDIRDKSFIYFAYGIENDQHLIIVLRWYFGICILFFNSFGCYKKELSNKINRIVRQKNRNTFNLLILMKILFKSILCWGTILIIMAIFKSQKYPLNLEFYDFIIVCSSFLAIIVLVTLYIIFDSIIDSIYAFIMINGCIIFGFAFSKIINNSLISCLITPNLLNGIQFNQNDILVGIFVGIIIEIVLILIYLNITKKRDVLD